MNQQPFLRFFSPENAGGCYGQRYPDNTLRHRSVRLFGLRDLLGQGPGKKCRASLVVFHAVPPPRERLDRVATVSGDQDLHRAAHTIALLMESIDIPWKSWIVQGEPVAAIARALRKPGQTWSLLRVSDSPGLNGRLWALWSNGWYDAANSLFWCCGAGKTRNPVGMARTKDRTSEKSRLPAISHPVFRHNRPLILPRS